MQETQVQSLSWEDPLAEGMATHSSILARRIPVNSGVWGAIIHGITKELDTTKVTKQTWSELSYSLFIAPSNSSFVILKEQLTILNSSILIYHYKK